MPESPAQHQSATSLVEALSWCGWTCAVRCVFSSLNSVALACSIRNFTQNVRRMHNIMIFVERMFGFFALVVVLRMGGEGWRECEMRSLALLLLVLVPFVVDLDRVGDGRDCRGRRRDRLRGRRDCGDRLGNRIHVEIR